MLSPYDAGLFFAESEFSGKSSFEQLIDDHDISDNNSWKWNSVYRDYSVK